MNVNYIVDKIGKLVGVAPIKWAVVRGVGKRGRIHRGIYHQLLLTSVVIPKSNVILTPKGRIPE